jgi:hypothetical protein
MLVYRYQLPNGEGPYRCDVYNLSRKLDEMGDAHNDDEHPGWQDYPSAWDTKHNDYRAACTSVHQLRQWFRGYNSALKRAGFNVVEVEVSDEAVEIGRSGKQCRFHEDRVIRYKILNQ